MTDQLPQKPLATPIPANETERLAALHRYKILDTPPEAAFDRITTLAARLFDMPTALISLVDESRTWFKSCIGFDAHEVPRDATLCSFAVLTDQPLIIPDAQLDDRFACNPFVQSEPGVRFYAGAPLLSRDGFNLGTLCLLDGQPRDSLSAEQQATLVDLAAMVVDELELRLAAYKIAQVDAALLEVTQGVAKVTGEAYFDALVQHFAKVLDADYVYIGLIEGDDSTKMLRTIATCAHGQIVDNLEYPLQETPCWEVIEQRKICCYPRNVQAQFPNAPLLKPLAVESYVAIPFFDSRGIPLGLLGVMDGKPLENVQLAESLLTIFALRIATELERQQTEAALRESEAKYRSLFESIDEGFCICEMLFDENGKSTDYRFLEVNSVFGKLTGLEQAAGKTARELIPDLEADWFEIYGRVVQTGEPARFEQQSMAINRWFDVNVFCIGEAQSHQFAVLFTNITERKRAEVALRQSEEQSRNILESITDAFFALDENWRFTYVNQTAYTMVNRTPGDLIGKIFWSEFPGVNDSQFEQMHRRVMRSRVAQSLTEFYPDHNRWYEVRTYPAANGVTMYFKNVTEQIQAESALRQSEARFRRIFECQMVPIGVYTSTGGISEANDALLHLIGYTRQELEAGQINWQELTPPQYWSLDEFALSEIATKGFSTAYEKVYIHKDGRQVPILLGAASFLDDPSSGVFFVIDLTERKQAEANLREAHVQLESALAAGCVYTWRWKIAEDRVIVNTAFAHLFGVDPETAAIGLPIELFVQAMHEEDRSRVVAAINQAISTGEEYVSEYRVQTATGEERWLAARGRVEYASDGRPLAFPGAVADITDRKRAEEDRDRFFQLSRDMLAIINTDGYFLQANPAWTETLGYTTQELTAQPYIEFVHPDDQAATTDEAQKIAQGSSTNGLENRYRCRDGSYRWISWSVAPFVEQGLLYCVARDVTERKLAEAERERLLLREQAAREEAEQANRLKDEFLAVLSHELRSPLNPILGWTRLLQNGKLDEARRAEALKTIERNARLQSQLIEDLLDISRIMQGKLTLNAAPVSLSFVISAALETVRLAAEAKNIRFLLALDSEIAPISGDAARLQQVVWNLLTNAVKFTPNGGQVTVELTHAKQLAQMRVIDTGIGIKAQFLPYVFEYFRQEDGSTTRLFGGLGLGLAIVRQIVEMHGGTVTKESQGENQGTTIIVQLPLMQAAPLGPEPTIAPADTAAPLDNRQILLVDDDTDTREFQAFLLEQSGAEVTAVASGLEALLAMDKLIPDVIVSDIGMAQMDGYMLIGLLRLRPAERGGKIPAIALTAYAAEVDHQKALQAGFQTFLTKPVEPESLIKAIINLFDGNQQ